MKGPKVYNLHDRLIKEYTKISLFIARIRPREVFSSGRAKSEKAPPDPPEDPKFLTLKCSAHLDAAASSSKVSNLFLAFLNDGVVKSKLKQRRNDNQVDLLTFQDFVLADLRVCLLA